MDSSSGKVVVAVDDTVDNLDVIKRIVAPVGYSFHGCSNGRALLALLDTVQPHVILLDVEMPELNGFELCQSIRQRPQTAHTPVLFVTGRNSHADLQRAIALGGNDFVVKPYDPIKLRARIGHWIQRGATATTTATTTTTELIGPPKTAQAKQVLKQVPESEAAHPSILQNIIRRPDSPAKTR
jgi:CheY-like chemotaxis protein